MHPIVLFLLLPASAFMCFSEYEFSWYDSLGTPHIHTFSVSHFQSKLQSFIVLNRRPPLKETFFILKIHHDYQQLLIEDCPFVLAVANLIGSWFFIDSDSHRSDLLLDEGLRIYNEMPRVQREITNQAWYWNEILRKRSKGQRDLPAGDSEIDMVVLVTVGDPFESLLDHVKFTRGLYRIFLYRVLETGESGLSQPSHVSETYLYKDGNEIPITRVALAQDARPCAAVFDYLINNYDRNDKPRSFLFLHDEGEADYKKRSLSLPLVNQLLAVLSFRGDHLFGREGLYYPLGKRIEMSRESGRSRSPEPLFRPYQGGHFFASTSFPVSALLSGFERGDIDYGLIESILMGEGKQSGRVPGIPQSRDHSETTPERYTRPPGRLRCDVETLPLSLRLCLGDEHWRSDWRSVLLSPVYPRRPIVNIDGN